MKPAKAVRKAKPKVVTYRGWVRVEHGSTKLTSWHDPLVLFLTRDAAVQHLAHFDPGTVRRATLTVEIP